MTDAAIASAQWTERLYPPAGGQDHLGLASVSSDRILPKLSPGIIVQTVHPRYVSFYTFLLDEFWRRDLPRTRAAFSRFFRPREAIFAVGAHLCDRPEHSQGGPMQAVVGSIRAGRRARSGDPVFDAQFDYIDNPLGGYGLYYGAVIADFGLSARATPAAGLPFDGPTPRGRELADAFRASIWDTEYYRRYFDDDGAQVPRETVRDYLRAACLCQLQTDGALDRPILREVYASAAPEQEARERRATLQLLLDLADQTAGHALTEDRFRQLIYYRADAGGASWEPRAQVARMARRWRLYQAREYYATALNRLWRYLTEWGQSRIAYSGDLVDQSAWWDHVDEALASAGLARALSIEDPGLGAASPLRELGSWAAAQARVGGDLDAPWDHAALLSEHGLYRWADRNVDPAVILASMATLALVAERIGPPALQADYSDDWDICLDGGVARLALNRFLVQWRRRVSEGATVAEAARWLVDDYVIRQHERIAFAKLAATGDTFRFRREGGRFRFFEADAPARMSSSRFQAISTTVHDLGYVGSLAAPDHTLTEDGRALLEQGDQLEDEALEASQADAIHER
jgi:hypothetical protein